MASCHCTCLLLTQGGHSLAVLHAYNATHWRLGMSDKQVSRRTVLKRGFALGAATVFAQPVKAAAPPPSAVTPALVEAARK